MRWNFRCRTVAPVAACSSSMRRGCHSPPPVWLIRRAVLTAAEREVAVDDSFLEEAVDEMLTDQEALTRALLGDHQSHPADPGSGESGWFAYGPGLHP